MNADDIGKSGFDLAGFIAQTIEVKQRRLTRLRQLARGASKALQTGRFRRCCKN
jgi:hypothetical protein